MKWDIFISYASEDRSTVARPLAEALQSRGLQVWYDEFELKVGDLLRRSIDFGLSQSRFGVVILSPHFLDKLWTQRELDGLLGRETTSSRVILPVLHRLSHSEVLRHSPSLSDRVMASTEHGIPKLVSELLRAIGQLNDESDIDAETQWKESDASLLGDVRKDIAHLCQELDLINASHADKQVRLEGAHGPIRSICQSLFPTTFDQSDGFEHSTSREPNTLLASLPLNIVPVPPGQQELEDLLLWSTLYSQLTIYVMPVDVDAVDYCPFSGGVYRTRDESVMPVLKANRSNLAAVSKGIAVFLPRTSRYESYSPSSGMTIISAAPLTQNPERLYYGPLNSTTFAGAVGDYRIYKRLVLPHFAGVTIQTIVDVARNETDAFVKFNYFLKTRLRQLSHQPNANDVRVIFEEIDYRVAELNVEAARISKLKVMEESGLRLLSLAVSSITFPSSNIQNLVAGIEFSPEVLDLMRSASQTPLAESTMRKSDFYVPFLLQEFTAHPAQ